VAIGAGTQVACEAAQMVIVRNNLYDVVTALDLARKVFNRIKLNFMWALGYNVVGIPFAAGLFYPMLHWRLPPQFASTYRREEGVVVVVMMMMMMIVVGGN